MVTDPDEIQQTIATTFRLSVGEPFSEYWMETELNRDHHEQTVEALRGARPISTARINSWKAPEHRERLLDCLRQHPQIPFCLFDWGYTRDFDWIAEIRSGRRN